MIKPLAQEFMTDERTTAYLLEELTELEAEQFEEQCFAQEEWPSSELETAEEDLIQAYIRKELSPEREQRFEEKYLTTAARKERLLLARSFLCVVCSPKPPKPAWKQRLRDYFRLESPQLATSRFAAIAAVVAIAVALTIWLIVRDRAPQTFAQLTLTISSENRSAGGQDQRVTLPLAEDALRISLRLPDAEPAGATYRVELEDVKGPIESLKIDSQDAKSVSVIIPAEKLSPEQYALKLVRKNPDGTEQRVPGTYFFNVE